MRRKMITIKFLNFRTLEIFAVPKIQTKRPYLKIFLQKDANGIAVKTLIRLLLYEQSDLGLHCLPRPICPKASDHYCILMGLVRTFG